MQVDRQSQRFLDAAASGPFARISDYHPSQLREIDEERNPVDDQARKQVAAIEDRMIEGPNGPIPIRIYWPQAVENPPVIVYFHGGGHGVGSINVFDRFSCLLCREGAAVVVSVDYRLAPEHKFPAGLWDAYAAYEWSIVSRPTLRTTSPRIALVGDSAGAALVAGVTLLAREEMLQTADYQVLIYPMLCANGETASRSRLANGYYVTREMITYYLRHYVDSEQDWKNPLVAPVLAGNLEGLPPALVITAEFDPLHDDGEIYAKRLRAAGVDVIYTEYGKTIHGFVKRPGVMEKGIVAVAQIGATLRSALGRGWDNE